MSMELPCPYVPSAASDVTRNTVASLSMNSMCAAPEPDAVPGAPIIRSATPSLFRSPASAADLPKLSEFARSGPLEVRSSVSTVLFTLPSRFISMTWTAPRPVPPESSPGAPTAISGIPSLSKSPMPDTDAPN